MTVAELIEKLSEYPPEDEVYVNATIYFKNDDFLTEKAHDVSYSWINGKRIVVVDS